MYKKIIFGAPGTGKTTRIEAIIRDELANGVAPNKIACVTFTKKGADEILARACKKFNFNRQDVPFFSTIHSLCFKQLGIKREQMIDKDDYRNLSKKLGMSFIGYYTEDLKHQDDLYLFYIQLKENNPECAEKLKDNLDMALADWIEKNYIAYKETVGKLDYTDLLLLYLKNGAPVNVDVAIIDEAQDLTTLQWQVVNKAFANCQRMCIAGDDDQAIYEWSGADVNYFLNIAYDDKEILQQSYRVPRAVHSYARKLSTFISHRVDKLYEARDIMGGVHRIENITDISINPDETYYFLSRNNYFLESVKAFLKNNGLVYEDKNGLSISNNVLKAIISYTKYQRGVVISQNDKTIFMQYMTNQEEHKLNWYDAFDKLGEDMIAYYRDVIGKKTDTTNCKIKVSTIHGVKGGEADNVVLLLDYTKEVDKNMLKNPDSEYRCYYVAVTRAKKNLWLVNKQGKLGYDFI